MWGGRFERGPASIMEEINTSVEFDKRLAEQDIAGSKAHARMLAKQGIIAQADADAIVKGLDQIAAEVAEGPASVITEQVANGVAVRMAVLYQLLGTGAPVA